MKIALIELDIIESEPHQNWNNVEKIISEDFDNFANLDFIVLPELFTTGYEIEKWKSLIPSNLEVLEKAKHLSKNLSSGFIFSMVFQENEEYFNRQFFISSDGKIRETYDKSHLFRPMQEHKILTAGENLTHFSLNKFEVGFAICYDLRFPEMFLKMSKMGVNLFVVVAEWPHPRCETFMTLAKARAIENYAFLVVANRKGKDHNNIEFCGSSSIIDPFGNVKKIEKNSQFLIDEISLSQVKKAQKFIFS